MRKIVPSEMSDDELFRANGEYVGVDEPEMRALLAAVWQVLDDMGAEGLSVCPAAKAQLRVAFEPFRGDDDPCDYDLDEARHLVASATY